MRKVRLLALLIVVLLAPAVPGLAGAPERISPKGVGGVELGATHQKLRADGLVGKLRRGCELGGPRTRAANLRRPLRGAVNYTLKSPRRVRDIQVRGGATARGVGIGDRIADIKRAFPRAKVERGTEETFGITLVRVPKRGGGKLEFAVDTGTERITLIGIPGVAFCE